MRRRRKEEEEEKDAEYISDIYDPAFYLNNSIVDHIVYADADKKVKDN